MTFWGRAVSLPMVLGSVVSEESLAVSLESFVFIFLYKISLYFMIYAFIISLFISSLL